MRPVRQRSPKSPSLGTAVDRGQALDFAAGLGRGIWLLTVIDGAQSHANST